MSAQTDDGDGTTCGALSCTNDADVIIDHPKYGKRIVCNGCTGGYPVIRHV
ncbi:hypothetical protein HYG81_15300 [Natrinema zhouii]|uniref:Uncharacterized protein n=1 Tax=Natrinema zhouii TaxID=1710539 RepID=A0A7D6CMX6_9EURY|nr:hypothetical protein [Natrinema zhouii]QLK25435.1 hypothetical protein HYG81_15300 [Natrinema zhouii]